MKCERCGRAILTTPAASIKSRAGALVYGPKCAALMGILPKADRRLKVNQVKPLDEKPPGQLDLFAQ